MKAASVGGIVQRKTLLQINLVAGLLCQTQATVGGIAVS